MKTPLENLIQEVKRKYSLAKESYGKGDEGATERMGAYVAVLDKAEALLLQEQQLLEEVFSAGREYEVHCDSVGTPQGVRIEQWKTYLKYKTLKDYKQSKK